VNRRTATVLVATIALLVPLATSLSGCGLRAEDQARSISQSPPTAPEASTPGAQPATVTALVWMVRREALVRVFRKVPLGPSSDDLLTALLAGPTEAESARGVRTAVGSTGVEAVDPKDVVDALPTASSTATWATRKIAVIRVADELRALPPSQQILALGQVVLTQTSGGFDAVVFIDGQNRPVAVPGPGGQILEGPIGESDYASLRMRV